MGLKSFVVNQVQPYLLQKPEGKKPATATATGWSIAFISARGAKFFEAPEIRALLEATYLSGLRKVGVPE